MYSGLRFFVDNMVDVYVNETKIRYVLWHSLTFVAFCLYMAFVRS
jgi:hypothetical protein